MTNHRGCCYSSEPGCDEGMNESVSSGKKGVMGGDKQYIFWMKEGCSCDVG